MKIMQISLILFTCLGVSVTAYADFFAGSGSTSLILYNRSNTTIYVDYAFPGKDKVSNTVINPGGFYNFNNAGTAFNQFYIRYRDAQNKNDVLVIGGGGKNKSGFDFTAGKMGGTHSTITNTENLVPTHLFVYGDINSAQYTLITTPGNFPTGTQALAPGLPAHFIEVWGSTPSAATETSGALADAICFCYSVDGTNQIVGF